MRRPPIDHVADGRPFVDDGHAGNADRLLDALRREHGDQGRADLAAHPALADSIAAGLMATRSRLPGREVCAGGARVSI
jgi:hypothetical protein